MVKTKQRKSKSPKRSSSKSILAEERHIGRETVNWEDVQDVQSAYKETLRHYGYFYDLKNGNEWAKEWIRKNLSSDDLKDFRKVEPWKTPMTAYSICKMLLNGAPLEDKDVNWMRRAIDETIQIGKNRKDVVDNDSTTSTKKSPADLVKQKTSEFIANVEEVLDEHSDGVDVDIENYSPYLEMKKIEAPYNLAKGVLDFYSPLKEELEAVVSKKDGELKEGYSHVKPKQLKEKLRLVSIIVDDAEKYMGIKKVERKPRKKKPVSAEKKVSSVKYLKRSDEFKLASVDPSNILGAKVVWLFNTKYRDLTRLECTSERGMEIKGTTIYGFDDDKCLKKKLRKPDEFFTSFTKTTKTKLDKEFHALTSKPQVSNGRLNDDTIIFKVYK